MQPLVASYVFIGLLVLASLVHGEFDELAQPTESYELTQPAVEPIEDDGLTEEKVPNRYLPALPLGGSSLGRDAPAVANAVAIANVSNPASFHLEDGLEPLPNEQTITTSPESPQQVKFGNEPVHISPASIVANRPYSSSSSSDYESASDERDYDYDDSRDSRDSGNTRRDGDKDEQSPGECVDHAENCAANVDYCQEQTYKPLMEYYCAKSCGYCPKVRHPLVLITSAGAEVRPQCEDSSPRCASWNEHRFCSSKFFLPEIKQRFCARTCGLCPDDQLAAASSGGTGAIIDASAVPSATARRNKGERKVFSWRRGVEPHRAYRRRDHSPKNAVGKAVTNEYKSPRPPTNRRIASVVVGKNNDKRDKNKKETASVLGVTTTSVDDQRKEALQVAATAVVQPPPNATATVTAFDENENKESQKKEDEQALVTAATAVVPAPPDAAEPITAFNEIGRKESPNQSDGQALHTAPATAAEKDAAAAGEQEKITQ